MQFNTARPANEKRDKKRQVGPKVSRLADKCQWNYSQAAEEYQKLNHKGIKSEISLNSIKRI